MAQPVHLVISDMNMPGLDGLALLKGLREYKPTQRIGFILVTGSGDKSLIERGKQFAAQQFRHKAVHYRVAEKRDRGCRWATVVINAARPEQRINIVQGEFHVARSQDLALTTVLGSCVAACIHDPVARVGGHESLSSSRRGSGAHSRDEAERYGEFT